MANQQELVELDGSLGSGGGQILRTATALSAITKKPCRVFNIRRNRPKPGLAIQHLLGLQALAQLCEGKLEGDRPGSTEISFYPGNLDRAPSSVKIKIETAGSITLILQTLIAPALFSPSPVKVFFEGGATDTFFSPTFDYFLLVFLKTLEKTGAEVEVKLLKRGYYPEGGANVELTIHPVSLARGTNDHGQGNVNSFLPKPLTLIIRGELKKILALSGASESLAPKKVAERQLAGVKEILGKLNLPLQERVDYFPTPCPGSHLCLVAEFEKTVMGTDNLGKLGKRAEDVGREAALALLKESRSEACLDRHMADQILPYMALTGKKSEVTVSEISDHCQTNMRVIEKFLPGRFTVEEKTIRWTPEEVTQANPG